MIIAICVLLFSVLLTLLVSKLLYKRALYLRDDWREFHKWFSTWFTAAGTALGSWLLAAPDQAAQLWANLPDEVKTRLPSDFMLYVPLGLFIAAQIVKMFKQKQ